MGRSFPFPLADVADLLSPEKGSASSVYPLFCTVAAKTKIYSGTCMQITDKKKFKVSLFCTIISLIALFSCWSPHHYLTSGDLFFLSSCAGYSTPCSSRYWSRAANFEHTWCGSYVVSSRLHHTSYSKTPASFYQWPIKSLTNHSCSLPTPKSYASGTTQLGNNASSLSLNGWSSKTWNLGQSFMPGVL